MKVEFRFPNAVVGACGMKVYVDDIYIPRVKRVIGDDEKEQFWEGDEEGFKTECKAVTLIEDNGGYLLFIIREKDYENKQ